MKYASLVIAALLATSGIALANGSGVAKKNVSTAPTPVHSGKADCKTASKAEQPVKPRLGYEGDPWIVPPFM